MGKAAGRLENPCDGLPAFKRKKVGKMLTGEELSRLGKVLASIKYRDSQSAIILHLILLTGCRPAEIMSLRWDCWDGAQRLTVPTKTGVRAILIGREAMALLTTIREGQIHDNNTSKSEFVFPSPKNLSAPRKSVKWIWGTIRKCADIRKDVRIYDLRHTFASMAVNNGQSLHMTGELLGHRRYSTTERYAHLDDREIRKANEIVGNAIEQAINAGALS